MRKIFTGGLLSLISLTAFAGLSIDNEYQSSQNPHYWKNRKPFEGYWQQDVHYQINAIIDDQEESVSGTENLVYTNNSPDTLRRVYFHLYQNAFSPNSYAHQLMQSEKIPTTFGEHEAKGLGTVIEKFEVNGKPGAYSIDNTILILNLKNPILPGASVHFNIVFKTYWDKDDQGNMRRRMKSFEHDGGTHFDGVHWYPRIAVYDRKFGWTTDQHLGKEFYGDFGQYDVQLSFPNHYIVEATGTLINQEEVLPDELRQAIDLKRFKTERSMLIEPVKPDGSTKTWKYHAINVHDFAFTADPTYRIGEVEWNGIRCIALVQEKNAHNWQETPQFIAKLIEVYSTDFGMYIYPKIIAADARDGMEYPMLTLDGGIYPGHKPLLAHEIGHNWFFGMVGNNETYRASLDEGFTQFLTAWSLKKIHGRDVYDNSFDKYTVFYRYLQHASNENTAVLETHSDYFNSAKRHGGGYGMVYYKTASMLYNLQYVLGDELFLAAMKNYVEQWKTCHPYLEDFRSSIIRFTKVDLNWFFDQWLNTNKFIDYKVQGVERSGLDQFVLIKRKTHMHMPLDIRVIYADGSTEEHYIPNTYFVKNTSAIVHDTWIGWDEFNQEYRMKVNGGKKIKEIIIDPSNRLADIYKLDNFKKIPVSIRYNSYRVSAHGFDKYEMSWDGILAYNGVDGLKPGLRLSGNYADYKHLLDLRVFYNSGILSQRDVSGIAPFSFRFQYKNRVGDLLDFNLDHRWLDGLNYHKMGLTKSVRNVTYNLSFKLLYRNGNQNLSYLIYPLQWQSRMWNNSLNFGLNKSYAYYTGKGNMEISSRASALYSDFRYASLKFENINAQNIGGMTLKTRLFAQLMTGVPAPESALNLAAANNEEMMDNVVFRSVGYIPMSYEGYSNSIGHLHYGGGLNLRGYSGYYATNNTEEDTFYIYSGLSGWALNAELEFGQILNPFRNNLARYFDLNTYLFFDAGQLFGTDVQQNSGIRLDAGLGTALTLKAGKYTGLQPLTLRFDVPVFLNRIPSSETDYLAFRYIIGISRAF